MALGVFLDEVPLAARGVVLPRIRQKDRALAAAETALGAGEGALFHMIGQIGEGLHLVIPAAEHAAQSRTDAGHSASRANGAGDQLCRRLPVQRRGQHLAGVHDAGRIGLGLEGGHTLQGVQAEDVLGLGGQIHARSVGAAAQLLRHLRDNERIRKGHGEVVLALVGQNKADQGQHGIAHHRGLVDEGVLVLLHHGLVEGD